MKQKSLSSLGRDPPSLHLVSSSSDARHFLRGLGRNSIAEKLARKFFFSTSGISLSRNNFKINVPTSEFSFSIIDFTTIHFSNCQHYFSTNELKNSTSELKNSNIEHYFPTSEHYSQPVNLKTRTLSTISQLVNLKTQTLNTNSQPVNLKTQTVNSISHITNYNSRVTSFVSQLVKGISHKPTATFWYFWHVWLAIHIYSRV